MREVGATRAVIVVNSEPCGVCSRNIPAALPKESAIAGYPPRLVQGLGRALTSNLRTQL
jgi:hypothetical protein